jgi:hypothetical protein
MWGSIAGFVWPTSRDRHDLGNFCQERVQSTRLECELVLESSPADHKWGWLVNPARPECRRFCVRIATVFGIGSHMMPSAYYVDSKASKWVMT